MIIPFSQAVISNGFPFVVTPLTSGVRLDIIIEKHSCCRIVPSERQAKRISML
jgi:hypothetical protein